ncbi:nuclear transport factor 2 family protein [Saccharopolyspora flava]|uniref:SnoaL-like domain-containing protein n=1 Tax=Saccharopolyspora flava TaxID=95161 RepID=A0A1I6TML9_9PSEU|nr:nuclear transport factor 2 family protein [Saccharopolyspora flava]SFS90446.1 SnoaL-like domain-containing protein [Saccharopolyspora flava]
MDTDITTLLDEGLRLLEAKDFDGFRARCTPGASLWENDGNGEQTIDQRMVQFKEFAKTVDTLHYEVVRRFARDGEVLQQHVLHVLGTDGSRNEVNAAVYFRFDGDLIDRIEEYGYQIPS